MKKREKIDLILILLWPIMAPLLSFMFGVGNLAGIVLFLIIPSLYLAVRGKKYTLKILLFSASLTIPFMIVLDYIAQITGTWAMFSDSLFPKLFGLVTFEVIIWAFFTCFFIVIFYEYFIEKHVRDKVWYPQMKYFLMISLGVLILFSLILVYRPSLLKIPYFYVIWGIILLLIPSLLHLFNYPKSTMRFFLVASYFFFLHFIYEVTALKLGWWVFPGIQYIGQINIFGVSFPLEEVIFWFILIAVAFLSTYDFFDEPNQPK